MRIVSNKFSGTTAILHTVIANTIVVQSNTASKAALLYSDLAVGTTPQRTFANQVSEAGNTVIAEQGPLPGCAEGEGQTSQAPRFEKG